MVEDDAELLEQILLPALREAGFDVVGMTSSLQLYRMWAGTSFDLVMLDVGLPDDDGVEIARHLRGLSPSIGIVLYTAYGGAGDRVRGLRAGADAYLVKPLDVDEVVQTIRNVLRRVRKEEAPAGDGWALVQQGWRLRTPSGATVGLNQAERQTLAALAAAARTPVPRDALIAALAGDVDGFDPHRLEMLVYRLRRKCVEQSGDVLPLRTVRGVGYMIEW